MDKLLTVMDVAVLLSLSPRTIRSWLGRKLPVVHCGRRVRIPSEAVQRFIEENTLPIFAAAGQTAKHSPKRDCVN